MVSVNLKCACGAEYHYDGPAYYITPGGARDERGRAFRYEIMADQWREDHASCHTTHDAAAQS